MKKGFITNEENAQVKVIEEIYQEFEVYRQVGYLESYLYTNGTYNEIETYFLKYYKKLPDTRHFTDRPKILEKLEKAFENKK